MYARLLGTFRDFSTMVADYVHKAWGKATVAMKTELATFYELALRVSNSLPASDALSFTAELSSSHPFFRALVGELDEDKLCVPAVQIRADVCPGIVLRSC